MVQEIVKFLKADTAFMNIRPLRYSLVLDLHPDFLPHVATRRKLRLRDAILTSYYPNEVIILFSFFLFFIFMCSLIICYFVIKSNKRFCNQVF